MTDETFQTYVMYAYELSGGARREFQRLEQLLSRPDAGGLVGTPIRGVLNYSASLSRLCWPSSQTSRRLITADRERLLAMRKTRSQMLLALCGLDDSSLLADRSVRNSLEHLDERFDDFLLDGPGSLLFGGIMHGAFPSWGGPWYPMGVFDAKFRLVRCGTDTIDIDVLMSEVTRVSDSSGAWLLQHGFK